MASYNSFHGRKMHGFKEMLTDVLVGRMGFDGFTVGEGDCDDDNDCTFDTCDETNSQCSNDPVPMNNLGCDDGSFCLVGESCQNGNCTGGTSNQQRWRTGPDILASELSATTQECCCTHNMLRLTRMLFGAEPRAAYADFYERALYNHILASIHPKKPGYVYFTPIRPDHYRVYSQPEACFWCCVGTGMENPGRYGEFVYASWWDRSQARSSLPWPCLPS